MSLIKTMRRQKAWYFAVLSKDVYSQPTFASAVMIDCRWDDEDSLQVAPNGEQVVCRATVYVDRDVRVGDVLLYEPDKDNTTPPVVDPASRITKTSNTPNIKATESLRTAWL